MFLCEKKYDDLTEAIVARLEIRSDYCFGDQSVNRWIVLIKGNNSL